MPESSHERISSRTLVFAITVTTIATLPVFLTGALAVQISRSLHVKPAQLGLLVGVFFASAIVSSVASGKISENRGGTFTMRLGVISSGVWALCIALFGHSYSQVLIFLIFAGVTNGAIQPAVNVYVAQAVPKSRQGFAFGVKQAAIPVATLLSGLAVPTIALTIGWNFAYVVITLGAVVLAVLLPRSESLVLANTKDEGGNTKLNLTPLLVLAAAMALGAGAANALGAFLVESAVHTGWRPGAAGLLVVLGSAAGLGARLFNGHLADKRVGRHFVVTARMVLLGAVGYLLFATGRSIFILPATIISYGLGWGWNGLFNFAVVRTNPNSAGRATGVTQSGAYAGSVLGPIAFGILVQTISFEAAWIAAAGAALISAVLMIAGRTMLISSRPLG